MRKWLLTICLTLCLTFSAQAEEIKIGEILDKVPLKQGVAYSLCDSEVRPMTSFSLIKKAGFSLDAGYVGEDKLVAAVFYELGELKNIAEIPLLEFIDIELGVYYGLEGINKWHSGEDYGVTVKLLEVKF